MWEVLRSHVVLSGTFQYEGYAVTGMQSEGGTYASLTILLNRYGRGQTQAKALAVKYGSVVGKRDGVGVTRVVKCGATDHFE
jgi:hypothetical protein